MIEQHSAHGGITGGTVLGRMLMPNDEQRHERLLVSVIKELREEEE
jgi:hypothetical protein